MNFRYAPLVKDYGGVQTALTMRGVYIQAWNKTQKTEVFQETGCNTFARYSSSTYTLSIASRSSSLVVDVDGEEYPVKFSEDLS